MSNQQSQDKKKKSTSLPANTVEYLKAWMMSPEHVAHPYPTEKEKAHIMADTGIELKQLTNWFVNNRKRYWKPRVEARLKQQVQAQNAAAVAVIASHQINSEANRVCFKVGLFPSQVDNTICQQNASDELRSKFLGGTGQAFQSGVTNQDNSFQQINNSENGGFSFASPRIQSMTKHNVNSVTPASLHNIANYFSSPCASNNDHNNTQVVSMGSTSSFSDSDSTSISNASHEENQEPIITFGEHLSPNTCDKYFQVDQRQANKNERTLIIGRGIAESLIVESEESEERTCVTGIMQKSEEPQASGTTPCTILPKIPSLKRVRSVSDFDAYSGPTTIIARPRSLTLNNMSTKKNSSHKRRFVEINQSDLNGWQNACRTASHGYDSALPTLEEAALLFGFAVRN